MQISLTADATEAKLARKWLLANFHRSLYVQRSDCSVGSWAELLFVGFFIFKLTKSEENSGSLNGRFSHLFRRGISCT